MEPRALRSQLRSTRVRCRPAVILFILCHLAGTNCDPPEDPPGDGFLDLALELGPTDGTVLEDMMFLTLTIERIEIVHRSTIDDASTERRIMLEVDAGGLVVSSERQGVPFVFARAVVPAGFITQIRLITRADSGLLAIGGESVPFKVPSGPQTGFKITPDHADAFPIQPGEITAVSALFDPATKAIENAGVGFLMKPTLPGRVVDPDSLQTIEIVTPGQDISATSSEQKESIEQALRQMAVDRFVSIRIAMIDRDEVDVIVRGTVTDLLPTPTVRRDGQCVVDRLVTAEVDQSFIIPVGPEIQFFASGGALTSDPGPGCPIASTDHGNPRLLVGDSVQVVLFGTVRDGEDVLFAYGGNDGITPLDLPPATPQPLRDAVDGILAHTEAEYAAF